MTPRTTLDPDRCHSVATTSDRQSEGELREANLNGAFLLRRLHRAASDIATTSDVTPSHRERLSTPTDVTA